MASVPPPIGLQELKIGVMMTMTTGVIGVTGRAA